MIRRAEKKAGRTAIAGAVTRPSFVVADVASMPFPDASFDVVISSYAVHHWPDRDAGLAEMMRVLRPGGRAIIWDIAPPHRAGPDADSAHDPHGLRDGGHPSALSSGAMTEPSLLGIIRLLMVFRRLPAQRYDFTSPAD
jgi:ubiquinone/menaquinone biosynthesis C-methylase UbiE